MSYRVHFTVGWGKTVCGCEIPTEGMAVVSDRKLVASFGYDFCLNCKRWLARPPLCKQCGGEVEDARLDYATPTCYACLPPPLPLPVRAWPETKH